MTIGQRPSGKRAIKAVCSSVLLVVGISAGISLLSFSRAAAHDETFGFPAYYTAARLTLLKEVTGNLQDLEWFRAQTRRYGFKVTDVFYGNPPSTVLLMMPLAPLPRQEARVLWTWVSLICWFAGCASLGIYLIMRSGGSALFAVLAVLALATLFAPLRANISEGQAYVFAFFLQILCCWLWLIERPASAGVAGGLLLAFKGYGLPLIVLGMLRRDRRFVLGASTSFGIIAVLAGILVGFQQWTNFFLTHLRPEFSGIPTPALQTFKSFLIFALQLPTLQNGPVRVVTPSADRILGLTAVLLSFAFLFWTSDIRRGTRDAGRVPSPAALAVCVLLNLLFSPRAEEHSYPLAMTAVLLAIPSLRKMNVTSALIIAGSALLFWPFHLQDRKVVSQWNLVGDFARLWGGTLVLIGALSAEYQRHRRRAIVNASEPPTWSGAYVAGALGVVLLLWYQKPWRDPMKVGPLLAVSRTESANLTILRLDVDERELTTIALDCKGPFGITFARREWLYSACRNDSKIAVVDLSRRRQMTSFESSGPPEWAMQTNDGREIWVSSEGAGTVNVYRAEDHSLTTEIPIGPGASDIVFSPGTSRAWISNEGSGTVSLVDVRSHHRLRDIKVGKMPQGMAFTSHSDKLLVTNFGSNSVSIVDTRSERELTQIPVCEGPVDVATTNSKEMELAYVSCFNGESVGVIDLNKLEQVQRIEVGQKPFGIAAHPGGGRVYVCVGRSNYVLAIETGTPSRILRRIKMDGSPLQIAVTP